mmetsp:Transcript_28551/g.39528  ORF Transcript_28551/g.39528 Transcript_28551/m.39528 type:complete len:343 (-) Transcript_28551:111-1139(-)|eukprot:CAMPEP_0201477542 /NCGR_PEP_ID=MMETSP0151_2-20130828/2543_1 /ASSEMBLY_ACC=CAM_ASM_000257 /TAXON_ID=200890 /ORGANISM="Paramoeba atlantica, Strain 621/1 / CCAP 1560/9" /LENGTH=342 /DNA_ID=CAMNT_0047858295 /DNA_START=54 /DNA_END=1082 /DNA_ORIENTATION=-
MASGWDHKTIPIEREGFFKTGNLETWYRVWGTGPIRVVFFHGGPGQACVDYKDTNMRILNPKKFTVLEVDQLGTGNSKPSLRDGLGAAGLYKNTTCEDVASAIMDVVDFLGWDKVFLHGGSWGSTLALLFAELYPERITGMVVRGIFLGTKEELDVTFSQEKAVGSENIKASFGHFIDYAKSKGFKGDPNSSKDTVEFFLNLFLSDDEKERDTAAWNWWVHELWAMDETSYKFNQIDEKDIGEARSVAFWEAALMLKMLCGGPEGKGLDLISGVPKIPKVPIYIVHGKGDLLCPIEYAERLEKTFRENGFSVDAVYIDSGHKVSNEPILEGVRAAVEKFSSL